MSNTTQPPSNTNNANIIIQLILTKISDHDIEGVQNGLSRLPLAVIPSEQSDTLINWFLTKCMEADNKEAARLIIDTFDMNRVNVDLLPAITQLFLNTSISHDTLSFSINCFPEKQPLNFYIDLVNMNDDINALKAAARIATFFPNIPSDDWVALYQLTISGEDEGDDEQPNQMLRIFFETKVAETGACVSTPSWVRDYPSLEIVPVPDNIPSVKDAVQLLLDDLKSQKVTIVSQSAEDLGDIDTVDVEHDPEVREQLISQYGISTVNEKIQMLSHIKHIEPFDDIPIFREFGPVNTIYTASSTSHDPYHICSQYGGCRMFLCSEFEHMHLDGEEIDVMAIDEFNDHIEYSYFSYTHSDTGETFTEPIIISTIGPSTIQYEWFRGSCDVCLKRIARKHHAVREPLCHGGWRGCYCSFNCLKQHITDPGCAVMVGRVQEQLDVIGIRDRL